VNCRAGPVLVSLSTLTDLQRFVEHVELQNRSSFDRCTISPCDPRRPRELRCRRAGRHAELVGQPESDLRPGDGGRIPLVTEAQQEQRTGREASTRESSEPVNYEVLINASHGVVSLIISGLEPSCYATLGISEPGILSFEPHLGHDIRTS
jgi:hypothetical protein